MKLKIAVSSQNKRTVTKHAGECRNYLIYNVEGGNILKKEVLSLERDETLKYTFHSDKSANSKNVLFDMDVLLTGSIGPGGVNRLAHQNVAAYVIREKDPDTAVEKLLNGTLEAFEPVHHHHHTHDHHHDHGCENCDGH